MIEDMKNANYAPRILYENGAPKEYAVFKISSYSPENTKEISSISTLLEQYYEEKNVFICLRKRFLLRVLFGDSPFSFSIWRR